MENKMSKHSILYLASVLLGVAMSLPALAMAAPRARVSGGNYDLVQYVNPFSGTAKDGDEFPGATMPFGMIQWSPDTGPHRRLGGYNYADSIIYGFSVDHLSGAGCYYGGDFAFSPLLGTGEIVTPVKRTAFPEPFSHSNETAHPGYYAVKLNNGITVQLTATTRTGFGRFIFPDHGTPTIAINAGSNILNNFLDTVRLHLSKSWDRAKCGRPSNRTFFYPRVCHRRP